MEVFDGSVLVPGCDHDGSLSDIEISDGMVLLSSKDIAVQAVARSGLNVVANHGAGGGSVFLNEGVERGALLRSSRRARRLRAHPLSLRCRLYLESPSGPPAH